MALLTDAEARREKDGDQLPISLKSRGSQDQIACACIAILTNLLANISNIAFFITNPHFAGEHSLAFGTAM
jgi:hypothetical protein